MGAFHRPLLSSFLLVSLTLAAPAAGQLRAGRPARLEAEPRLRRTVSAAPAAGRLRELAAGIARATSVPLGVQPDLGFRNLRVAWRSLPAADALRALAVTTGGEWLRTGETLVLTDQPHLAPLIALPQDVLWGSSAFFVPSLRGLSPAELALLAERGVLFPHQMSRAMRQTLLREVERAFLIYSTSVSPEALQLDGVFLATAPLELPGHVGIRAPRPNGAGTDGFTSIPYERFRFGEVLAAGPPRSQDSPLSPWTPRRDAPRPMVRRLSPGRPAAEEARFAVDTRLDKELRLGKRDAAGVFDALAAGTLLSLVAATAFQDRDTRLERERTTAREAMKGIERATGGTWRIAGDAYALQPDDRAERLALISPSTAPGIRGAVFAAFQAALPREELQRLRATNALPIEKLKRAERERLQWAAAVAFATLPKVGSEALELKDVTIRLLPEDPGRNLPARVEYALPGISGTPVVAAEVPLERKNAMSRFDFATVAALALAAAPSLPARAGHYDLLPESTSGSATVTPPGGSPRTTEWKDLDQLSFLSSKGFTGRISFSYSETWYYYWVPGFDGDEPTGQSYPLTGTTTLRFGVTPSSRVKHGSANASITMFGVTYSASSTCTPNDAAPPSVQVRGAVGAAVRRTGAVSLSGAEGTFTVTYSGSASSDAGRVMTLEYGFARTFPPPPPPSQIRVTVP